ncbi:MAG TPA: hypothetical protein P5080_02510 [Candidatus Paceibacterota bacterium]|nr:hypothetical protein [Candidatus Pacearchaeota archaeon]HRZ50841.1 hypothetical protein [Candidatus Paceibacterota bacterium]HSA36562.1 hypothetical protein [Candidatus Paceibacterota bacterium]
MSQESIISYIESWDEQIKDELHEFGRLSYKLGITMESWFELYDKMSWLEINLPWLPLVRKDRFNECQSHLRRRRELSKLAEEKHKQICDRLERFIGMITEEITEEQDAKERKALGAVHAAFSDFLEKFRHYDWFSFFDSADPIRFDKYYPDARAIYDNAKNGE